MLISSFIDEIKMTLLIFIVQLIEQAENDFWRLPQHDLIKIQNEVFQLKNECFIKFELVDEVEQYAHELILLNIDFN